MEDKAQLFALPGGFQLRDQAHSPLGLKRKRFIVEIIAVLAPVFGGIHGDIGVAYQGLCIAPSFGVEGNSQGDPDIVRAICQEDPLGKGLEHPLGDRGSDRGLVDIPEQDQEFVAANTGDWTWMSKPHADHLS